MKGDVELSNTGFGGIGKAFQRLLANEPMVTNTFSGIAGKSEGKVCFAPGVPGDVIEVVVEAGKPLTLTRGAALC